MNSMSNKFLLILFCWFSLIGFAQPNYNVNIYNNPYPCNLFFHVGGPPSKPVNIVDSSGTLIYSHDFGLKGWAWQVNENNKITFFDRQSKGWFIMDSLENITGLDFFSNLEDSLEKIIEQQADFSFLNSDNKQSNSPPIKPENLKKGTFNTVQSRQFIETNKTVTICGKVVSTHLSKNGHVFFRKIFIR